MKRKIAALFVAAALGAAVPVAAEKRPLTLEECVALGLANSKGLHASAAAVEASASKAREAGAALLPVLKLGAGYTRLSEVPPFEVHLPFPAGLPFPMPEKFIVSPNYFNSYTMRLGLQQPLYTGGRLRAGVAAARYGAEAAELDLAKDRAELGLRPSRRILELLQGGRIREGPRRERGAHRGPSRRRAELLRSGAPDPERGPPSRGPAVERPDGPAGRGERRGTGPDPSGQPFGPPVGHGDRGHHRDRRRGRRRRPRARRGGGRGEGGRFPAPRKGPRPKARAPGHGPQGQGGRSGRRRGQVRMVSPGLSRRELLRPAAQSAAPSGEG